MATTTDTKIWFTGGKSLAVRLIGYGDTAETDAVKVDKSTLTGLNGQEPSYLKILEATGTVAGADGVLLEFDGSSDQEAVLFPTGYSEHNFTSGGGLYNTVSGATGDIVATTIGISTTNNMVYQIDLLIQLMD